MRPPGLYAQPGSCEKREESKLVCYSEPKQRRVSRFKGLKGLPHSLELTNEREKSQTNLSFSERGGSRGNLKAPQYKEVGCPLVSQIWFNSLRVYRLSLYN